MIKKELIALILLMGIAVNAQTKKVEQKTVTEDGIVVRSFTTENSNSSDQEFKIESYKVKQNKGILILNLGKAVLEGYDGNEIIFEKKQFIHQEDERGKGLQAINHNGLIDNTGIGLNVKVENDIVEVKEMNIVSPADFTIKVPKNMKIVFKNDSQFADQLVIKNLKNEIEVDVKYASLVLENVSGPVTANLVYGNIEASLSEPIKGPISFISIYGFVDLALPIKTNADFKLSTQFGEILTEPILDLKLKVNEENGLFKKVMLGKMNAGGNDVQLKSDHGKIYIRSSK